MIYIPNPIYLGLGEENDDIVATVNVRYTRMGWWFRNDLAQNVFIIKYISCRFFFCQKLCLVFTVSLR